MSVDLGSIEAIVRNFANTKGQCLSTTFDAKSVEIENAKHPDGDGTMGKLAVEGPTDEGTHIVSTHTCPVEYGGWQNDGVGPILPLHPKEALFNAKTGWGPYAHSAGPPGSHWWDELIASWPDVVSECAS